MRLGELLALEWRDVDWRSRTIRVQRNLVRGQLGTPKNHQCRTIDMSPGLVSTLRLYRRKLSAFCLKQGMPRPAIMFPSDEGTHLDDSNVRKVFSRLCDKAEFRHRSPHDMRHTYASLLLSARTPILHVSQQLGHKDSVITLRTYATWLPKGNTHAHCALLDTPRLRAS